MFTVQIGITEIHFLPLIVILIIGFAPAIIYSLLLRKKGLSMIANCKNGEYNKVIAVAPKLLKFFQSNRFKHSPWKITRRNSKRSSDNVNICLAVSYLGLSNHDMFLSHIHQVTEYQDEKNLWLSVYYWMKDDMESFQTTAKEVGTGPETQKSVDFLTGLRLYKEGNTEEAIAMLNSVLPNLRFEFLKNMVYDITKQHY